MRVLDKLVVAEWVAIGTAVARQLLGQVGTRLACGRAKPALPAYGRDSDHPVACAKIDAADTADSDPTPAEV